MTILRGGCYERVSTEEQALRGYSIETQIDNLTEYCEKEKIKIVKHYTDEGISGAKPPLKRPALKQLLDDVRDGKIDVILFTKLDRWFRSVKEYYKVQDMLDKHGVAWKAIHESYDTTTANGRLAINVFLSVAQNEQERTSERIKVVFDHKAKNKEAFFGGRYKSIGYMKKIDENGVRRLVKDPAEQEMTQEFWDILVKHNNLNKAIRHMYQIHGVKKAHKSWAKIARNPLYCGMYRDVEDFCEPYVTKQDWLRIQETANQRRQDTRAKRIYIFSGLMHCPNCGSTLCGMNTTKKIGGGVTKKYNAYRCRFKYSSCGYTRTLSEIKIEKWLLANIESLLKDEIATAELEKKRPKPKPKTNISALKEQLRRLNVMYMAGNVSDAEYLKEDAEIKAAIAKAEKDAPPPERDLTPLKQLLETDFLSLYKVMDEEEKRRFWRSIIKEIKIHELSPIDVVFVD